MVTARTSSALVRRLAFSETHDAYVESGLDPDAESVAGVVIVRSDAAPFFANTSDFHDAVIDAAYEAETMPSTVVVDMVTSADVDVTAGEGTLQLYEELGALGIELKPARVGSVAESDLDEQGIVDAVGPDSIYPTVRDAVDAARPRDV